MTQAEAREDHRTRFRETMVRHGKQMDAMNARDEHMRQHLHIAKQVERFHKDIRSISRAFGFCLMFVWVFAVAVFAKMFL